MRKYVTRQEYMNSTIDSQRQAHSEYYGQYVNDSIKDVVLSVISIEDIRNSSDFHFNDIPLIQWDTIAFQLEDMCKSPLKERGDFTSLGSLVCIAKEAARQIRGF